MNFLSESVIRELASTIWFVLHVRIAHAHDPKIPLPVHTCCKSTVFAVFSSWIPLTHTFPIPMHTHAHTPSCRFWGDIDVDSLSTGWVFFSTTSKISSLPGILFSVFFFCLPVHSLSLFLCRCSVQWPATSFLFPVSVHTYLHTVSFLCQPLCAAWRLNSSQWVDLSSLPVCVYVHLSRLQYSYGDEKYSFRGGGWVLTSSDRNVIFCSLCSDSSWAQIVNIFTFPLLPICAIVGQNQEFLLRRFG